MKRILILLTLTVVAVSLLAGCASETGLKGIQKRGTILIGTEGTYAPFTFHDESGKLTGFDVEIAEEVAKRLGVKAEFIETKWDGIFAGLDSKRFDAIANEVSIRADRLEKYDFSRSYIQSRAVLIVKGDNETITKFEDLKGKKSGQSLTSNFGDIAKGYGAELVSVDGFNQSIDLITSGRIDASINDSLSYLDFKNQKPDADIKIAAQMDEAQMSGIMFRKGNPELVAAVNQALEDMIADGTHLKISKKWFGEDVLK